MTMMLTHPDILPETTRADLMERGDLIALDDEATRLRWRHPVACTREVWEDCVEWTDEIEARKTGYSAQETDGRLRDMLWHALLAAKRTRRSSTYFTMRRVPTTGTGSKMTAVTLLLTIGPGDNFEPVVTISFPEA